MALSTLLAQATNQGQSLGSEAIKGIGILGGGDNADFSQKGTVVTRFVTQISNLIGLITIVAGIYFVVTFLLAGFDWLSSGGDKGKVEKAQNRMTSAAIGLLIVIISIGIIGIVGGVFGLDILNLDKLIYSIIPGQSTTINQQYAPPWTESTDSLDKELIMTTLIAQLTNPAVPAVDKIIKAAGTSNSGVAGAALLGRYIAILLQTSMVLGGLAVLLFFTQGALEWITASGDHSKVEKAQNRMTNAVIGLGVLSAVVALAAFIGPVFGMDLLKPVFINQIQ